jgi:NAD(P)-dependent dehydrogenase (short-subunit alcohol dehydrogenase family)
MENQTNDVKNVIEKENSMRLTDKFAVVTGANGDQGKAVTARLRKEGASVLAIDLKFSADYGADMSGPGGLTVLAVDIADRGSVDVVAKAVDALGGCDVLYNNAGVYLPGRGDGPASEVDMDIWNKVLAVNLTGAMHMIKATLPTMVSGKGGVIINVASLAGVVGSRNIAYTASKSALIGITKSIAFTHGVDGVRSVALSLGPVDTGMMDHARHDPDLWAKIMATVPLGRAAQPDEIASWASFLASDEAAYANGANIVIDGGRGVGV